MLSHCTCLPCRPMSTFTAFAACLRLACSPGRRCANSTIGQEGISDVTTPRNTSFGGASPTVRALPLDCFRFSGCLQSLALWPSKPQLKRDCFSKGQISLEHSWVEWVPPQLAQRFSPILGGVLGRAGLQKAWACQRASWGRLAEKELGPSSLKCGPP